MISWYNWGQPSPQSWGGPFVGYLVCHRLSGGAESGERGTPLATTAVVAVIARRRRSASSREAASLRIVLWRRLRQEDEQPDSCADSASSIVRRSLHLLSLLVSGLGELKSSWRAAPSFLHSAVVAPLERQLDLFPLSVVPQLRIDDLGLSAAEAAAYKPILDAQVASLNWLYAPAQRAQRPCTPTATQLDGLRRLSDRSLAYAARLDSAMDIGWADLLPSWAAGTAEHTAGRVLLVVARVGVLPRVTLVDPCPSLPSVL